MCEDKTLKNTSKTLNIFLASSEELENDRMAFGNLIRRLDQIYEKRGMRIKLFEWEDYDAAFNGKRKQDEYNEHIKRSDLFLALFHTKAGQFTLEEFDVATEEFRKHASPKIYIYCKDLEPGQNETTELMEFKQRLLKELGHYWCRYSNRDTMQLHFVMQLQLVESALTEDLVVENGSVKLDGLSIAKIENLPFVAKNEECRKRIAEINALSVEIKEFEATISKLSKDNNNIYDLLNSEFEKKQEKYSTLKNEITQYQDSLLNSIKQITKLQKERITDRMFLAMEAFNAGDVNKANGLLCKVAEDAKNNIQICKRNNHTIKQKKEILEPIIGECLLKAAIVIDDTSKTYEDRLSEAELLYDYADEMACEIDFDKIRHDDLLRDFISFLISFDKYDKALIILDREMALSESIYGINHTSTALSYSKMGYVYSHLSFYSKALEYHEKALKIRESILGENNPTTAFSYYYIGQVYVELGDYQKALDYQQKALAIRIKALGEDHLRTAASYHNIGWTLNRMRDFTKALEYYEKALKIREKILGVNDSETASTYSGIGGVYTNLANYPKALEYCLKALESQKLACGYSNNKTAIYLSNIGYILEQQHDLFSALEYCKKALEIRKKLFKNKEQNLLSYYCNVGRLSLLKPDYDLAIACYQKALEITEQTHGYNHMRTSTSLHQLSRVFYYKGDYTKAIEFENRALAIREIILNPNNIYIAKCHDNLGIIFEYGLEDNKQAIKHYKIALEIKKKALDAEDMDIASSYERIADAYLWMDDLNTALIYLNKRLELLIKKLGPEHHDTIKSQKRIEMLQSPEFDDQ